MDPIKFRNPHCKMCELHKEAKTVCLFGVGNPKAELMFVGEAPGQDEDRNGKPFVGAAGQILGNILREFGIQRDSVYISNSVKCRPPNNRRPHVKEIRSCNHYLLKEIKSIRPKVIVALGQVAMATLLDTQHFKINSGRGKVHYSPWKEAEGIPIIVTYHPAAVKRDNSLIEAVFQDFNYFLGVLKNGIKPRKPCTYKKGVSRNTGKLSIDLETSGLNPFLPDAHIICFGSTDRSYRGYCSTKLEKLKPIVSDPNILKIGHNIKFDIVHMLCRGFKFVGPIHDTMVAEHILNENVPSYGLKELAATFTDMGGYAGKLERQLELVGNDMSKVPLATLMEYCSQDVDAAYRLYKRQVKELYEQGLNKLFKLVMEGELVIAEAEYHGVQLDLDRHLDLQRLFRRKIAEIKEEILDICGKELVNPNSSTQLGKVLVGKLGFPALRRTKTGKVAVDEKTLKRLLSYDKIGIVKRILKYRKLRGDYTKYLNPKKIIWQSDGRVHANFRISGTDTGRYSCTNPNLQAVPRESPIKSMFVSAFPGGSLVQIDYDQGELRLLAHFSQDRSLLKAFKSGVDIHKQTAADVFNIKFNDVTEKQRYEAKQLNFSIIYGMGPASFARETKMSVPQATKFINDYKKSKPGVTQYIRDMSNQILELGYVENLFKRRRRIPIVDLDNIEEVRSAQRRAVNAPIQSTLHELNILAMTRLARRMKELKLKSRVIMAVHDSVIVDCPKQEVGIVTKLAKEIFTEPDTSEYGFTLTVPMTVTIKSGKNWKEASGK